MRKNQKRLSDSGLMHPRAKLTQEQEAAIEGLTDGEVSALIAVNSKLKPTFGGGGPIGGTVGDRNILPKAKPRPPKAKPRPPKAKPRPPKAKPRPPKAKPRPPQAKPRPPRANPRPPKAHPPPPPPH